MILCQRCWLAHRGLCEATCHPEFPVRVYCLRCGLPLDVSRRAAGRADWWMCERGCNRDAADAIADRTEPGPLSP